MVKLKENARLGGGCPDSLVFDPLQWPSDPSLSSRNLFCFGLSQSSKYVHVYGKSHLTKFRYYLMRVQVVPALRVGAGEAELEPEVRVEEVAGGEHAPAEVAVVVRRGLLHAVA